MQTMGLGSFAYWSVNYVFYFTQYMVVCVICRVFSGIFTNMRFYTLHDPWVLWGYLILWGNVSTALAMLLSVFFKSARTASAVTLLLLYVTVESGRILLSSMFLSENYADESQYYVLNLFPPITMLRAMYWFAFAAGARAREEPEGQDAAAGARRRAERQSGAVHRRARARRGARPARRAPRPRASRARPRPRWRPRPGTGSRRRAATGERLWALGSCPP